MKNSKRNGATVRVAQVVLNMDVGGLERVVIDLITGLDRERFEPVLYCLGDGGPLVAEVEELGCDVHVFDKKEGLSPMLPFRIGRRFKADGIGLVHCHNLPALIYGGPAGKMARVAGTVYTPHGVKNSSQNQVGVCRRLGFVDSVVAVSDDTCALAIEKGGFAPERTRTIVNGIDVDKFAGPFDRSAKLSELGLPESMTFIGNVARLVPEKDHINLMETMALLTGDYPNLCLLVIGDGPLRGDIEARAAELELGEQVRFLGTRHDVDELLRVLDIFVLSSRTEGLSITLLEAMGAALPIVATDVGGNAEVVLDGKTGLIAPRQNPERLSAAIRTLLDDPDIARKFGKAGRERAVEQFSVKKMVNDYQDVYEQVLSRNS